MNHKNVYVGIFIPVYHRDDLVKTSLESLSSTIITDDRFILRVSVWIGVNGASDELKNYLLDYCKNHNTYIGTRNVLLHAKNIGKPSSVNRLVDIADKETPLDYVVSYDSDMVVTDPHWLLKLVQIYEDFGVVYDKPRLGALCPAQAVGNCHVLDKDPFKYSVGNYTLVGRAGNEGVAGGVLLTSMSVWRETKGYEAHRLYASDDGHFMLACHRLNRVCLVVQEVSLIHPREIDPGYADWKARACHDKLLPEEQRGYWEWPPFN